MIFGIIKDLGYCENIITIRKCYNIFAIYLFSVVVGLNLLFYFDL